MDLTGASQGSQRRLSEFAISDDPGLDTFVLMTSKRCNSVSPLRKRARYDGADPAHSINATRTMATRDETYYFSDGSCVLLVDDILFNVHRTILSKDSSIFSAMFTLPQGSTTAEGANDDMPVVLSGHTAAEFRNFLWALYATPLELEEVRSDPVLLPKLIDIARISNKYSFPSFQVWSLDAIQEYVARKPSPIPLSLNYQFDPQQGTPSKSANSPNSCSGDDLLIQLVTLAHVCGHEKLQKTMINLLQQLMGASIEYAYLAMTLSDDLDIVALRGAAYFEVMQNASIVGDLPDFNDNEDGQPHPPPTITSSQKLRLLTGYYRLTRLWENLRLNAPAFNHAPSCGSTWHQHGCNQSYAEFWKEKTRSDAVLAMAPADVTGRLRQVCKEFDRWGSATYMHHDCRNLARRAVGDYIKKVEDCLGDFFSEE